ncbi:hypothetical protein MNBD_ALPHA11-2466 [hydrothermal vent metagenome]|uniref:Uncharacterized protein n=1 Tax=hydrothermal vent metagenome TaxID=652676 RepID=A0A3B0U1J6_9ZZZZ
MTSIQKRIIKPKLGMLELAKQLGSISQPCNPPHKGKGEESARYAPLLSFRRRPQASSSH